MLSIGIDFDKTAYYRIFSYISMQVCVHDQD